MIGAPIADGLCRVRRDSRWGRPLGRSSRQGLPASHEAGLCRRDVQRIYQVKVPASARSVPIPAAFLQANTEYELEIHAIEESGNWTFATSAFFVE
jgi:hypothetical protein